MRRLCMGAIAVGAALAACVGCGASRPSVEGAEGEPHPIDALRQRAHDHPNDPDAWRLLVEWETFGDRGDADEADEAIDHALGLSPSDPVVLFARAVLLEQHALHADALEAYLRALEEARTSVDPLAHAVAEATLSILYRLRDDVHDWDGAVVPVVERVLDEPGRLGMPARELASDLLIGHARRRGDPERVASVASGAGCLSTIRVAGPFGPDALLGFDERLPAQGPGPMADEYDLGPNRGVQPTREIEARGCTLSFSGGALSTHGSWIAEGSLPVEHGGPHLLAVQSGSSVRVRVDGEQVGVVDRRERVLPRTVWLPVDLSAGEHELELTVSTRSSSPSVQVRLDRPSGDYAPDRGVALPEAGDPGATVLRALVARARGDGVEARETLRALDSSDAAAATLILAAKVSLSDPFLPGGRRRDEARRLLRRAVQRDGRAYYPALRLAQWEQGSVESLARMREVTERWPEVASLQLALADMLDDRGFRADADRAVERARELMPDGCRELSAWYSTLRDRMRYREANALVEPLMGCDARSRWRWSLALRQRRWDDARRELERLRPLVTDKTARSMELGIAVAVGDRERERQLRAVDAELYPLDDAVPLREADRLLAEGDRAGAVAVLDRAIAQEPGYMASLVRVRRAIAGGDWMDRYRVDGSEVIRRFEESGRTYEDHGQVLVFDYMVTRVFEDGSSLDLVHQILRVQSEESIERLGQLSLPGRLLTLRTIKPDGRVLEPDRIAGLDSIAMPSLAVGDYVEYEYVRQHGPRRGGGMLFSSWVFQSFSQPFDISKLVVLAPTDVELVVDARGPVPDPVRTTDGDLSVLTWTVEESRPLVQEPSWVPRPELLPRIAFGVDATWEQQFDALRDTLVDRDPHDPAAARLVRRILGDAADGSVEERARRLRSWLLENVEGGGDFDGVAPVMLQARTGSRTRLLRYLLEMAGIDAHLAVARSFGDREPSELVDPELFGAALVVVPREGEQPLYLWAEDRGAPLDYLPPAIRGQQAVVLAPGRSRVRLPDPPTAYDRQRVAVDARVGADGTGRVEVVETLHGASALFWRQQLEEIPAAELERRFEAGYAARVIPGSHMTALDIEGRDQPDRPLVLSYTLEVPSFGRRVRDRLVLPPLFTADPASAWAQLPARTSTERVWGTAREVVVKVQAPGGVSAPVDVSIEGPGGARYRRVATERDGAVVVRRTTLLPRMLVPAGAYSDFAAFCRRTTEAEQQEISVGL